jgi:hypothetical protein
VQRAHHLAELADAGTAVGVHRVGALGRLEVERVVAPVEAVASADRLDAGLLVLGGRSRRGEVARRRRLGGPVLLDRGDVERRKQVHGVDAGLCELLQLSRARRVAREGAVGAALGLGHRLVGDREVPHVQLVDRPVDRTLDDGRRRLDPLRGLQRRVVEVDDHGARRIRREGHGVRVGDRVRLDLARRRGVDLDRPAVLVADRDAVDAPRAVGRVELRRHERRVARGARLPALERHRPRGRRPEAHLRVVARHRRAERRRGERIGVEVVEHARHLHAGERRERAVESLGDADLLGEQ